MAGTNRLQTDGATAVTRRRCLAALLACLLSVPMPLSASGAARAAETPGDRHAHAVALARAGHYDEALAEFGRLRRDQPGSTVLLHDETLVLAWAGQDERVLANAKALGSDAPAPVLKAAGKSARNLRRFAEAEAWYRRARLADGMDQDAGLGLAMSLADAHRHADALAVLESLPATARDSASGRLATGYLHEQAGRLLPAVAAYDAGLAAEPEHPVLLRARALALRGLGLPGEALAMDQAHPGLLSREERAALHADMLALRLRDALNSPAPAARKYSSLATVLSDLEAALGRGDTPAPVRRRLAHDRIVTLTGSGRLAEAIAAYEALPDQAPAYVHIAMGSAYLEERRPEDALRAWDAAENLAPGNVEAAVGRAYALTELERHGEAQAIAAALAHRFPTHDQVPGSRIRQPNRERLMAEVLVTMGPAYASDLAETERRLEALLAAAPNNPDLRRELGNVYRWRGWPDRALGEYRQVLALEPEMAGARAGRFEALVDRQDFAQADDELAALRRLDPAPGRFRVAERRWELHGRSALTVDGSSGDSSGQTFGSEQYAVDAWWYTAPWLWNYRAFVHTHDTGASLAEGDVDRRRAGAGIDYRRGAWSASAELHADRSGFDDPGMTARTSVRLTDSWTAGAVLELNSLETPLRAWRAGIESDLAGLDLAWRASEALELRAGWRSQDFDDGNDRTGAFTDGRLTVHEGARVRLDLTAHASASRNTLDDAPYFNPHRDTTLLAGVDSRWRSFRRYERETVHRLYGWTGTYRQRGFGAGGIWTVGYELSLRVSDAFGLRAGWQRGRHPYDGAPEYETTWLAGLDARF